MSGLRSRNKGKRGEREVVKILQQIVGDQGEISRAATGYTGYDIKGLDWLAIEVKFQETLNVNAWWQQTLDQAKDAELTPVLFYRKSRQPWTVRTRVEIVFGSAGFLKYSCLMTVDFTLEEYAKYLKAVLQARVEERKL